MTLNKVLTAYSKVEIGLPYHRYSMYMTGAALFSGACAVFSLKSSQDSTYWLLGGALIVIFCIWHPQHYSMMSHRNPILKYDTHDIYMNNIRAKPFISLFYLSYILIIPTVCLCYLGFGRMNAAGSQIKAKSLGDTSVTISQLVWFASEFKPNVDFFTSTDGFVAYNLSKSMVHTLTAYATEPHDSLYFGLDNPIVESVYGLQDTNYSNSFVSEVPLFGDIEFPLFQDVLSQWTVAPIFQSAHKCLQSPAPVHITCMLSNKVIGWAVATDVGSFCKSIKSPSCSIYGQYSQSLSVYYPEPFNISTPPTTGFTGYLARSPPDYVIEAVKRRFVADGWPFEVDPQLYPDGMPKVWFLVAPEAKMEQSFALGQFERFRIAAIVFLIISFLSIIIPFVLDVVTDRLVVKMIESYRRSIKEQEQEEARRDVRRKHFDIVTQRLDIN